MNHMVRQERQGITYDFWATNSHTIEVIERERNDVSSFHWLLRRIWNLMSTSLV